MCALCDRPLMTRRHGLKALAGAVLLASMAGSSDAAQNLVEPVLRIGAGEASSGEASSPVVALTLDACSGQTDRLVLESLITRQLPATLFLTAQWMARNDQALALIKAHPALFAIGNHGGRHLAAVWGQSAPFGVRAAGSPEAVLAEVEAGEQAILAYFGHRPRWFRGATAHYNPQALPLIAARGYAVAGYSLNGDAGASLSAEAVTRRIEKARSGDVILAHLNHPERPCGKGLVAGLDVLRARGFRFTHLDGVWQETRSKQL
jgi:peptidoglycan/xylan/chitin deacetylase (PgdA/CDA1 family)